jgi:SAM-dependent methyltransferase
MAHYLALRAGVTRGTRLLYPACGAGAAAIYLAEWFGCAVTGLEPRRALLARAQEAARERDLAERVRFLPLDAGRPGGLGDLPAGTFDVALAEEGLRWAAREGGLDGLARVLRPGGRLALGGTVLQQRPEPSDDLPRDAGRWNYLPLPETAALAARPPWRAVHVEPCHFLLNALFQPARERLLAGERPPGEERACREYDRTGHRFLGWGLVVLEKARGGEG